MLYILWGLFLVNMGNVSFWVVSLFVNVGVI